MKTLTRYIGRELLAAIMPQRPVLYEISHRYAYYRIDASGRFLMGGRSIMHESDQAEDYATLREHVFDPSPFGADGTHVGATAQAAAPSFVAVVQLFPASSAA